MDAGRNLESDKDVLNYDIAMSFEGGGKLFHRIVPRSGRYAMV